MSDSREGFYLSNQTRNGKANAILAVAIESLNKKKYESTSNEKNKKDTIMFQIYKPNTGSQVRHESLFDLQKKYKKATSEEAETPWTEQYDASINVCTHTYYRGSCRNITLGLECEVSRIYKF